MKRSYIYILLLSVFLTGCGEYQKILKSKDPDLKYEKAIEYFEHSQWARALSLFEDISTYYKGTERSEYILNYISRCHFGNKDYTEAANYYEAYIRNYPKGKFIIESRYMVGHCYYLESPDARLDQELTHKAIDRFERFVEMYPESGYAKKAWTELSEMYDKLALKEYYSAKLYYNLGSYLGNNYESCVIVSRNALKKYPANSYQEEFSWLITASKYEQVSRSVDELKEERLTDAEDECYNFLQEYPQSKHRRAVEKMQKELSKIHRES